MGPRWFARNAVQVDGSGYSGVGVQGMGGGGAAVGLSEHFHPPEADRAVQAARQRPTLVVGIAPAADHGELAWPARIAVMSACRPSNRARLAGTAGQAAVG